MLSLPCTVRVFVAVGPADLRKGCDGLAQLSREVYGLWVLWTGT
jgi:hypothetical protein